MTDRQGVEIDYCPKCRGVWLDRGELDKIIERSAVVSQAPPRFESQAPPRFEPETRGDYREPSKYSGSQEPYKKKKGGFLGDIFDF